MIISVSRQFIFVHTMKTAGDSIAVALEPYVVKGDYIVQNDFQAWRRRIMKTNNREFSGLHKHSTALEIRQCVPAGLWDSCYKFAFVRNPIQRAISFYNYLGVKAEDRRRPHPRNAWYLTPAGKKEDPNHWPAMKAFLATNSFSEFIRYPSVMATRGMQPQSDFLSDPEGKVMVDFVGKFERLEQDMATVQEAIGLPRQALSLTNSSRHGSAKPQPTREDLAYLAKQFEDDFTRFDYDL
jgi:hypothetical protein